MEIIDSLPKYEQLANILKAKIEQGGYAIDTRIPSQRKLAKEYDLNFSTVNKAVSTLISSGMLYQKTGRGIYVADQSKTAVKHPIALIHELSGFQVQGEHVYYGEMIRGFNLAANRAGFDFRIVSSSLDGSPTRTLFDNGNTVLSQMIRKRELSGMIIVVRDKHELLPEVTRLGIPYVFAGGCFLGEGECPNWVDFNWCKALSLSLEYFSRKGVKKVGMIPRDDYFLSDELENLAEKYPEIHLTSFTNLDEAMKKTDGLFITDDYFVLNHILELSSFSPLENIVVLGNTRMQYPISLNRIDFDVNELIQHVWEMLTAQLDKGMENLGEISIEPKIRWL